MTSERQTMTSPSPNWNEVGPTLLAALKPLAYFSGSFADEEDRDRLNDLFANARDAIAKAEWNQESLRWRGRVLTGQHAHYCDDWDGLPMDETCPEWPCVCCKDDACLKAEARS